MKILSIIQPDELGEDFRYESGVWHVNFPSIKENKIVSDNAGNAVIVGTDGGAYLSKDLLLAYALVQDNSSQKILMYQFPAGTEFDVETATLVSSVNLIELNGVFDDVAIDNGVITFTDVDSGQTLTLDTKTLQRIDDINAGEGIDITELNGVLTISVMVVESEDNLIEVTPEGLLVSKEAVIDLFDISGFDTTQKIIPTDDGANLAYHVGNDQLLVPQLMLANSNGVAIAFLQDIPEAGITSIKVEEGSGSQEPALPQATYSSPRVQLSRTEDLYGFFTAYVDGELLLEEFFNFYELNDALININSPITMEFISSSGLPPTVVITNTDEDNPHTLEIRDLSRDSTFPTRITYNTQVRQEYDRRGFKKLIIPLDVFSIEKPSEFSFPVYVYPAFEGSNISNEGIDLEMTVGDKTIKGFLASGSSYGNRSEWDTFGKQLDELGILMRVYLSHGIGGVTMNGGSPLPDDVYISLIISSYAEEEITVKVKGPLLGVFDIDGGVPTPWVTGNSDDGYTLQFTWSMG